MKKDYPLKSNDELTELAKSLGINTWRELTIFVQNLPYGRNRNRVDLGLVLQEKQGTCSSKHALLKRFADLNDVPNVDLILGMYKMTECNTPQIGNELTKNSIDYIPEAHCYLRIDDERLDFTTKDSNFKQIESDILTEVSIEPSQVAEYKIDYHKKFIKQWLFDSNSEFEFDEIWRVREQCIQVISE